MINKRVAGLARYRLLISVGNGTGKASCQSAYGHMELGSKFLDSLFKNQEDPSFWDDLLCECVDGANHSQKDGMEGNGGSLDNGLNLCAVLTLPYLTLSYLCAVPVRRSPGSEV